MNAFLSYSFNDKDGQIIPKIIARLRQKNIVVHVPRSTTVFADDSLDVFNQSWIRSSQLFIGVITNKGHQHNKVISEWRYAIKCNIPTILLIEDKVSVPQAVAKFPNTILFNRNKEEDVINLIEKKTDQARDTISARSLEIRESTPYRSSNNALAWFLGGIAVGLIVGALSSEDSKK